MTAADKLGGALKAVAKAVVPRPLHPLVRRLRQRLEAYRHREDPYAARLQFEVASYTACQDSNDLPPIFHYWTNAHIVPLLEPFGFRNAIEFFCVYTSRACAGAPGRTIQIASVGAGDCASEVQVARRLVDSGVTNFRFECVDVNASVLERGRVAAAAAGVEAHFQFTATDLNAWAPTARYDIVLAIQFLHHVVELERLFASVRRVLAPGGRFLIDDMVGRNGHRRWPEALAVVEELWRELPEPYRFNHKTQRVDAQYDDIDWSGSGFEGVRAQDIMPLLLRHFHFEFAFGFANVIDPFVDRAYGGNFDPEREWDRAFIDRVHALDMEGIESGRLKPTHVLAALSAQPIDRVTVYKHLTPEFVTRWPDPGPWRRTLRGPRVRRTRG